MSYNKQNFEDGQVLEAQHLNHIEDGIEANSTAIENIPNSYSKEETYSKEEIDSKIAEIESGSGGGTSFSGSYNDLTDKPDLGKFALSSMVETNINAIRTLTQPSFLKYISFNDTNEVIIALSQENRAVMSEWIAAGNFVRPIYLWDVTKETYYPMTMATVSGVQYEIYFQKDSTLYIGIYDSEQDSYGFSE